jgi:hypothetical protein
VAAHATLLTRSTAKAAEASSRMILFIVVHPPLVGRRKEGVRPPPRNVTAVA